MRYPLVYLVGPIAALLIVTSFYAGGIWLAVMPAVFYLLLPIGDTLTGLSLWPSEHRITRFDKRTKRHYDMILLAAAWSTVLLLGWALYAVSVTPLTWWEFTLIAVIIGEYGGFVGIVTAHELMHRRSEGKRQLAFLLMALEAYSFFCIEHVHGHHRRVATPDDPATARAGQSLYAFLPRTVFGSFRSALRLERERLARKQLPFWSHHNLLLRWQVLTIALMLAIYILLGPMSLLLFVVQALFAIFALETINYIEHYGLLRKQRPDGSYESVRPAHSWNSNHILTNVSLFNLGRHSDHHHQSSRRYYTLRHYDEAPQLPYGYSAMVVLAMLPPLWFRVMDRELARFDERSRALG
jgi:alkane 1-monooxygenase